MAGNSTYFEIYIFTKEKVGIVKELKNLNCLHVEHDLKKESSGKLCVWVKQKKRLFVYLFQRRLLFSSVRKTKKMSEFIDCNVFFEMWDEKGSMTWALSDNKVSFLYYFNKEKIDLGQISDALNVIAVNFSLSSGWKTPFHM